MATHFVGYDLNKPEQDYTDLIADLKSFGTWWHSLDSTWLVKANLTAKQLRDRLAKLIDENDELLVIDVSGDAAAWRGFDEKLSKWLKDNL